MGWMDTLASQLEDMAQAAFLDSPDQEDSESASVAPLGLDEPHCPSSDAAGQGESDAESAGHRGRAPLCLLGDPAGATETLRRHPVLERALAGPDGNDAIQLIAPYWASRVELGTLVQRLVHLAARTSGKHAAGAMHRLLELGESHGLKGYETTLFDGLDLDRRIDIDDHAYLAPYRQVERDHGPPVSVVVGRTVRIIEESPGQMRG